MAVLVALRARSSSTCPSRISVTMTPAASKYTATSAALAAERRGKHIRQERGDQTVRVRDEYAEPDEREHVQALVPHRLDRTNVEWPGRPNADRRRQEQLEHRANPH